jgi:hypothetical protein
MKVGGFFEASSVIALAEDTARKAALFFIVLDVSIAQLCT